MIHLSNTDNFESYQTCKVAMFKVIFQPFHISYNLQYIKIHKKNTATNFSFKSSSFILITDGN